MDPLEARRQLNAYILELETDIESVNQVRDASIPCKEHEIPIRIYEPDGDGPFPLLIFIHGAGWVAGNLDTHDNVCRCLCSRVKCVVLSVDYRLAPECKFPVPVEESYHVYDWSLKNPHVINIDPERIAIGGDSAGGNIAAGVCLVAKDRNNLKIIFQLLVNPALDLTGYEVEGFENMRWFRDQYLRDEKDIVNPHASPLLAKNLENLPSAFIITGEHDVLSAEGEVYARRLREAGVSANLYCQGNKGHLSGEFARATKGAEEAVNLSVVVLKEAFKI
jgi:acetyl esterase